MKHVRVFSACLLALSLAACSSGTNGKDAIETKVEALLGQMTLQEKIGQMNQVNSNGNQEEMIAMVKEGKVGSFLNVIDADVADKVQEAAVKESRLGIPVLMSRDVIHGYKTIFPIPLGQAATFNPQMVEDGARVAAIEASADGIRWTFAPMIDVSRDARWGRMAESCGEDPCLNAVMGVAMVKGFQGDSNVYLPPFEAVARAGCATFMTSFNDNDGVPSTGNRFLLKDVLRHEWGYDGMVVTDWASAGEMVPHGFCADWASAGEMVPHGFCADRKEAAEKAVNAGVDMEMVSGTFMENLEALVKEGKVSETAIDEAVRNILRLKFRLGLFDNPYTRADASVKYAPEHLAKAQEAAEQSVILLKNHQDILPLTDKIRTIAVVGPMADAPHDQLGTWCFDGEKAHTQTPLKALREQYGDKVRILYEPGVAYSRDKRTDGIARAVTAARNADVVIAFVGEEAILSGEAHSLADLNLKGAQPELLSALAATGRPLVTVFMAGRPLTIARQVEESDAVLYAFHPGTMGGPALANILFGKVVPSGKTPVTFPRMTGQCPIYYAHHHTGRAPSGKETLIDEIELEAGQSSLGCSSYYLDAGFGPLFPFGYGLSYTTFAYDDLKLSATELNPNEKLTASVKLTNTGKRAGTEVVQLYVRDKVGSVTRPVKELKGFQRITLQPGETQTVTFELPIRDLAFWNIDMKKVVEPGDFTLWIGTNSDEGLSADFKVKK